MKPTPAFRPTVVAAALLLLLLASAAAWNVRPRAGPPDLEAAAARAGLVRVHESGGVACRAVVYAREGARWRDYRLISAPRPGVVVIEWLACEFVGRDEAVGVRVGDAVVRGDPAEVARVLALARQ